MFVPRRSSNRIQMQMLKLARATTMPTVEMIPRFQVFLYTCRSHIGTSAPHSKRQKFVLTTSRYFLQITILNGDLLLSIVVPLVGSLHRIVAHGEALSKSHFFYFFVQALSLFLQYLEEMSVVFS